MPLKLIRRGKIFYLSGSIRGQRYVESTRTGSRPHAEAYRLKREREILDGTYLGEGRATLFSTAVLVYLEKGGDGTYLEPLIDRFGALRLGDVTPAQVSAFARERYGRLAPATVKRQLYTPLNAVMRAAHRAQLGPLFRFDPPKVKRSPVTYADDRTLELFFRHAQFRVAAIVLFMTLTGARVSEACRLAPADVDLERGEAILRKTKSGKARRVPLAPVLVETLRRALVELVKDIDGSPRLFGYSSRWSVNQAIERVCDRVNEQAGCIRFEVARRNAKGRAVYRKVQLGTNVMPALSSHKVGRHAFAARLLAQGQSLKLVQDAGGWATIQVVSESYGHLEQQAIDDAVRGAGASLPALPAPKKRGK